MKTANRRLYKWELWFSHKTFKLQKGKHFQCAVHGMTSQIRNYASRHGKKVSVGVQGDEIVVNIRE